MYDLGVLAFVSVKLGILRHTERRVQSRKKDHRELRQTI